VCGNDLVEALVLRERTFSRVPEIYGQATTTLVHYFLFGDIAFRDFRLQLKGFEFFIL
jgi:hypothetical protein